MSVRIGIVGASASGIYAALLCAHKHKDATIVVFDRADKVGKKLLATGNGHCNLMHVPLVSGAFNHPEFVQNLLDTVGEKRVFDTLKQLGILTMEKDGLLYPLSYSAASHVRFLSESMKHAGIEVRLNEAITGIEGQTLFTKTGRYEFDEIIFAFGGKSQSNLGSNGSLFPMLQKLGYKVTETRPSLCPIKSPDVDGCLFGVRHPALVRLEKAGKALYEEAGEVQFKDDALSGIAVMNASSKFEPGCEIVLDLFPNIDEAELAKSIYESRNAFGPSFLDPILGKELVEYVLKKEKISANEPLNLPKCRHIARFLKEMRFRCSGLYGFESSQVTRGGIALEEVDKTLTSKRDCHHHFIGECLDIDGLCGGYNLGFALLSAIVAVDSL